MSVKYWYKKPLRILQTVLCEVDAETYDADAVVKYMEETHCNTLIISGGGIMDFFKNPLITASPVKEMGDRDILREITDACHKKGFYVIARIDFRGVTDEVYARCPPEWFSKSLDGGPIKTKGNIPILNTPCYNSYYRNEHGAEFIKHIMKEYKLDGIWHNALLVHGICYCDRCKELYKKDTGKEIPIEGSAAEKSVFEAPFVNENEKIEGSSQAELDEYYRWKAIYASKHMNLMRSTVKSFGEDKVYVGEVFKIFDNSTLKKTGVDFYEVSKVFDFLVSVAFLTPNAKEVHYENMEYIGTLVRFLKDLDPEKQPVVLYGTNGTSHRYVMDPPQATRSWLWDGLSLGSSFWNCVFNGVDPALTKDRRNAYISTDAYKFIEDNESTLDDMVPCREVAIYYSKKTLEMSKEDYGNEVEGIVSVLNDHHVQFGFVNEDNLSVEKLKESKIIVLPNVSAMNDKEVEIFKSYVKDGGKIISTYQTSLLTGDGSQRKNFALSDMFGVSFVRDENTTKDCYQYVEDLSNPLLKGIHDTQLLIDYCHTCVVDKSSDSLKVATSFVPAINNQPPEKAWRRKLTDGNPVASINSYGKGTAVYFSNQVGKSIYVHGHEDFRTLFANAIDYLIAGEPVITTNAPESVRINLIQKPGCYMLSLVNETSAQKIPLRSIVNVHDVDVSFNVHDNFEVTTLYGDAPRVEIGGTGLKLSFAVVKEFSSVLIKTI